MLLAGRCDESLSVCTVATSSRMYSDIYAAQRVPMSQLDSNEIEESHEWRNGNKLERHTRSPVEKIVRTSGLDRAASGRRLVSGVKSVARP